MPQFPSTESASGIWSLKKQKRAQQGSNWPLRSFGDFLWNYVTALFKTTSTNGAQNNTFLDSSTNNFTITRNGNTAQGTFTPYGTLWSNYFDGNGDYLTAPNNTALDLSTGDFTVEFWFYPTVGNQSAAMVNRHNGNYATPNDFQFGVYLLSGNLVVRPYQGTTDYTTVVGAAQTNAWNHAAFVRTGNTFYGFLNGVRGATSQTISGALNNSTWATYLGAALSASLGNDFFTGYLSNVRILKGTALYTANFTPPTAPLTAITNTSLLTCQSNRFRDNSSNSFTITRNGDVSVQDFAPFGSTNSYSPATLGGSGYFDGSGDYLITASNAAMAVGTGDFTLECWVYATSTPSDVGIYEGRDTASANGITLTAFTGTSIRIFSGSALVTATNVNYVGSWCHVAVVRSSGTTTLYINGVSAGSSATSFDGTRQTAIIGGGIYISSPTPNAFFPGYISDFRLVKGTAVYSGNFTPPTAPLAAITNTSLLLNFTNSGIFDAATVNDVETVGNAQVSTTQAKFGGTSMYFDGSGDWVNMPPTPNLEFDSGNFTIEFWLYPLDTTRRAIYHGSSGTDWSIGIDFQNQKVCIWASSNGSSWNLINADGGGNGIGTITVPLNTWSHVAFVRFGNTWQTYINGIRDLNLTGISGSIVNRATSAKSVGKWFFTNGVGTPTMWNGYIDEFRVTKGYARYWYPFTPPTLALADFYEPEVIPASDPLFDYTTLLLPGNGTNGAQNNTFLDSSTNNFTITRNGNTSQGTFTPYGSNWSNYFDGSSYLQTASNAAFGLGTGDFTIEMWVFPTSNPANGPGTMFDLRSAETASACVGRIDSSLQLRFYNGPANSEFITGAIALNVWTHIAFVRTSGSLRTYISGALANTTSVSSDLGSNQPCFIGLNRTAGYNFNGYISNFRIVKGTAVYPSAFTPNTTPLTAVSGTSILTCQSNRFIDNSSNTFAITSVGSPSVQRFSPFNPTAAYSAATIGGSGYFDGSGDYLTIPTNAAFSFGTGDFTISTWIYTGVDSLTGGGYSRSLFTIGNITGYLRIAAYHGGTTGAFRAYIGASTICDGSTVKLSDNAWHNITIVRESGNVRHWIDGIYVGTVAYSTSITNTITNGIGADMNGPDGNWNGYIAATYVNKGTALFTGTSNITVPTTPPTTSSGNSLLVNYTNAAIVDSTTMNDLETVGNAQISTSVSKFGGGSLAFDGNGDALALPANINLAVGGGDFTIEMWVNGANSGSTVGGSFPRLFTLGTAQGAGCIESYNAAGTMYVDISGAGGPISFPASTLLNSTWNHYAITRVGTSLRAFVNGTQVGTTATNSTNINLAATTQSWIGAISASAGNFNGYIDDLRITKGIARYVQPFTPPTQAFQTQ